MEFYQPAKDRFGFRKIHPLLMDLIRSIPSTADLLHLSPDAENRIFPGPVADGEGLESLAADWSAFVAPDLHRRFTAATEVVEADLRSAAEAPDGSGFHFEIPLSHAESWLNTLNQVRLILATNLGLDSDDAPLDPEATPDLLSERGLGIFQINLFAFMQQCLIEQLE